MSLPSSTNQQDWSIRPTVQCDNPHCRYWNDEPTPGMKCVKCFSKLPTWIGYLNNNSGGNILEKTNYSPPPIERTACQEYWYDDDESLQQTCTDGDAAQEKEEHIKNAEKVVRDIMHIYNLNREGALNKLDQLTKNVTVTHS